MALIPSNPADKNKVAIGFFAVVLAFAYWNWVYSPKSLELETVRTHVETLDAANQRAKAELAKGNVNDLRLQAEQYRRNLEVMRQLVPTGNEVPALLEQVSTAARRVNLDIGSVEPLPVIVGNDFDTYRYRMAIGGDYHAIARFLTNVGSLPRIMAPVNLTLAPVAAPPTARNRMRANTQFIRASFEVQTYVAKAGSTTTDQGLSR
jgi:type IV pilus assembly protein PilO